MRTVFVTTILLTAVVAVLSIRSQLYGTAEERSSAIQQAINEAKAHSKVREDARIASAKENTPGISVGKHFKQVSKEGRRQGVARLMYEDMVHRAERKLAEMERLSHAETQDAEARAEELADELFHRPGTQLTEDELARMKIESGCTARPPPRCFTPTFQRFRRIDGVCNNLNFPFLGSADTEFTRLIDPQYEDGISSLRGGIQARASNILRDPFTTPNPSARFISQTIVRNVSEDEQVSHIVMQWGQFLDHDMTLGPELEGECSSLGCTFTDICEPIRVPDRDPAFGKGTINNAECLHFSRSLASCEDGRDPSPNRNFQAREQINILTSFLDASMVYGSDDELARRIRAFKGGLLLEGNVRPGFQPDLPKITQAENHRSGQGEEVFVACPSELPQCFLAGEFRVNEQIVLTVMHTIWFREHNRIARQLSSMNSHWSDERIYQEARRIVGALVQKITYEDFLPIILGQKVFNLVIGPYLGYDATVDPGVNNAFATAAFRFGHTLIRPFFDRLNSNYLPISSGNLNLRDAFFAPEQFEESFGTDPILRGLLTQNSRRVDEFLTKILTTNLFREQIDLASLNIQRGRDHGLPPYLNWQQYCRTVFPPLVAPSGEVIMNGLTYVQLMQLYGGLNTADLWVTGLAEERLPNSLLGPTFACLFGITFANLRNGDRFFYLNPGVFEPEQVKSLAQDSLSRIICDTTDNIDSIQENAFVTNTNPSQRKPCSQIPRTDLSLWKEDICYFGVTVKPAVRLPIRTYSRTGSQIYHRFFQQAVRIGTKGCIPVICPGLTKTTEVIVFTTRRFQTRISIETNSLLPKSSMESAAEYNGIWTATQVDNSATGLFRDLTTCQGSTASAFTITVTTPVLSLSLEQSLLQQTEEDAESPSSAEGIPEDIRNLLMSSSSRSSTEPTAGVTTAAEMESEAQLMSDLEEALNAFNV